MKSKIIPTAALACVLTTMTSPAQETPVLQGVKDTRIGKITFDLGFPSKDSVSKL